MEDEDDEIRMTDMPIEMGGNDMQQQQEMKYQQKL
jgi:hypothetical protein